MVKYYLAVDIGASSGRHILGSVDKGKIILQEVYRFENLLVKKDNQLCWDFERLFTEILIGMKRCGELGKIPSSMGIDTWAVDFVLLDQNDVLLGNAVAYRDSRTSGMDALVSKVISQQALYKKTGIQKQIFNTIYQLTAIKHSNPLYLEKAKKFLMVPEYFNYLLTGVKKNEYTNATTTQLVNAQSKTWDKDLITQLQINPEIFGEIYPPKTTVGALCAAIREQVGFDCEVVLPATHDTGSAVMAIPANDGIFLSSGTWSLMGVERKNPDCSECSRSLNFTNEGGFDYRFRYLKNIMGLWIIQSARHELEQKCSFDELGNLAQLAEDFPSRIDVNDPVFLSPKNMTQAVKDYCTNSGQLVPKSTGELFSCIYYSLAKSYGDTTRAIEQITNHTYDNIYIVGGGAKDAYLNTLTAQYTGKRIFSGPIEATAIGNLLAQMLKDGAFANLTEARQAVSRSFEIKEYL